MRISVLILGLLLGLLMFFQTVLVYAGGSLSDDETLAGSAAIGVLMALMWLVACALVLPFPLASTVFFALAGFFGLIAAATSDFADLYIWAAASAVLALMSFSGWRGKVRDRREAVAERQRQLTRDAQLDEMMRRQART